MDREYIAIGPNCWGRGYTRELAVKAMKKTWPTFLSGKGEYEVYSCTPGSYVNEHGQIGHDKLAAAPMLVSRGQATTGTMHAPRRRL